MVENEEEEVHRLVSSPSGGIAVVVVVEEVVVCAVMDCIDSFAVQMVAVPVGTLCRCCCSLDSGKNTLNTSTAGSLEAVLPDYTASGAFEGEHSCCSRDIAEERGYAEHRFINRLKSESLESTSNRKYLLLSRWALL